MYWFKHYSDASEGLSLKTLWSNKDYEAIAVFWRLCELLSTHDSRDGVLKTNFLFIARETGMKPSKCRRVLARISAVSLLRFQHDTDEIQEFLVPKWSEFQETRGKKKDKKNQIPPGDIRSKNIDIKKQIIETTKSDSDAKRLSSTNLKKGSSCSRLIAEYAKAYKARYNASPVIDGRTQGLVKKILSAVPEKKACDLVQAFLQMNDPWFVKKAHDFVTFYENMTKVSMALQTGQDHGAAPKKKTFEELLAEQDGEKNGPRFLQTTD